MKRADHHNTTPLESTEENLDVLPSGTIKEEEIQHIPVSNEAPTMGALPVDTPGSQHSGWHSSSMDEAHINESEDADETVEDDSEEFVAVGTGPDPENTDI